MSVSRNSVVKFCCWMCGAAADSAEHRIKKSDIVRVYGKGPYSGGTQPIHFRNDKQTKVQGPNSQTLKYGKILCADCNTTKSQPYDHAYEQFIEWIMRNQVPVLRQRFVDFERVFGADWENRQRDLYKYFAKSFGCRLAEISRPVPDDITGLFSQTNFETGLRLTFAVNEDILLLPPKHREVQIGKGGLNAMVQSSDPSIAHSYTWDEHNSWFTTFYWYSEWPNGSLGSTWVANSQFIYLGSFSQWPPNLREEMLEKLATRIDTILPE